MPKLSEKRIKELKAGYNPERYTFKGLISEFLNSIYHLGQKKIIHTAIELTIRPAKAIKNVIRGFRQYLYNPLEYLIVIATLISLFNNRYHFFSNEATTIMNNNDTQTGIYQFSFFHEHKNFFHDFFKYSEDYPSVVNIVAIPVFAFYTYVFFRKYKIHFGESIVLNTFITAQQLLFLIFLVPFDEFLPTSKEVLLSIYTFFTIIFNIWVYVTFFEGKIAPKLLRAIAVVFVSYFLQLPLNALVYYIFKPVFELISKL